MLSSLLSAFRHFGQVTKVSHQQTEGEAPREQSSASCALFRVEPYARRLSPRGAAAAPGQCGHCALGTVGQIGLGRSRDGQGGCKLTGSPAIEAREFAEAGRFADGGNGDLKTTDLKVVNHQYQ